MHFNTYTYQDTQGTLCFIIELEEHQHGVRLLSTGFATAFGSQGHAVGMTQAGSRSAVTAK